MDICSTNQRQIKTKIVSLYYTSNIEVYVSCQYTHSIHIHDWLYSQFILVTSYSYLTTLLCVLVFLWLRESLKNDSGIYHGPLCCSCVLLNYPGLYREGQSSHSQTSVLCLTMISLDAKSCDLLIGIKMTKSL